MSSWRTPERFNLDRRFAIATDVWDYVTFSAAGDLIGVRWDGETDGLYSGQALFGDGHRLGFLLANQASEDVLLAGDEGSELVRLEWATGQCRSICELSRFDDQVGGMRYLRILQLDPLLIVHWELGFAAVSPSLDLVWRRDLEWNHEVLSSEGGLIWVDYLYDTLEGREKTGEPWCYSVATGELVDDSSSQ